MKKIMFIFLAHVLVLGTLWVWRTDKGADHPQDAYNNYLHEPVIISFMETNHSGSVILMCIDEEQLKRTPSGEQLSVSLVGPAHAEVMSQPEAYEKHICYRIDLRETDPQCNVMIKR